MFDEGELAQVRLDVTKVKSEKTFKALMFRLIDKADENRGYVTAAIYSSKDRITGMLIDDVNQLTTF